MIYEHDDGIHGMFRDDCESHEEFMARHAAWSALVDNPPAPPPPPPESEEGDG